MPKAISCVLFDLDGTLVDTAPDLIVSLNHAISAHGYAAVDAELFRPYISCGAIAMIDQVASDASTPIKQQMLSDMLKYYQANVAVFSRCFTGILEVLSQIERSGLKWGVVTNKRERFSHPLLQAMQLHHRTSCLISGDTTEYSKPHPEPMLAACQQAKVAPEECIFIGDAEHDITAGNRVDMTTLVALYGYLKKDDKPETWGADGMISSPNNILPWITMS